MKNIILIISSIIRPIISLQQITPPINPLINQKICINCKYFISDNSNGIFGKCSFFPTSEGKVNLLVTGVNKDEYYFCSTARDSNDMCGEEGKYYKKEDS
jgi:hypothetical protein